MGFLFFMFSPKNRCMNAWGSEVSNPYKTSTAIHFRFWVIVFWGEDNKGDCPPPINSICQNDPRICFFLSNITGWDFQFKSAEKKKKFLRKKRFILRENHLGLSYPLGLRGFQPKSAITSWCGEYLLTSYAGITRTWNSEAKIKMWPARI